MKLTVNELFSGLGSQSAALERLGADFKVVGIAEIDKYAIKSYEAIHGPVRNYGDISEIDKLDYADFWTYSFPCQDISVAGKQRGINENTRSGLLYQVERLLKVSQECGELPKWLMLENVKNLVGKQFKPQFDEWIARLDELGFNTYWQVLNAKNYGIPQNRERVFAISIRKDVDTGYEFPKAFDNGKRLKDILETVVDEKYYLSSEKVNLFIKQGNVNPSGNGMNGNVCTGDICNTLTTNKGEGLKIAEIGKLNENRHSSAQNSVLDTNGICTTIDTMQGGNRQPKILEPQIHKVLQLPGYEQAGRVYGTDGISATIQAREYKDPQKILIPQATKQGYIECNVPGVCDLTFPNSKTRRGRVQDGGETCPTLMGGMQDIVSIELPCIAASRGKNIDNPSDRTPGNTVEQRMEFNKNGTSNTITTVQKDNYVVEPQFRIRKLTPLECWRLMGFADLDFFSAMLLDREKAIELLIKYKDENGLEMMVEAEILQKTSNSQLYQEAGNSIVVDVLYYLFLNLFINRNIENKAVHMIDETDQLQGQMSIFDFGA